MNRKQLTILLILLVVLGAGGLILRQKQSASWRAANPELGKKLLGEFPVNDVAQITIREGTNEVTLAKKDETWRVVQRADYPANFSQISEFLITAKDLKVVQTEEVGPSQLPRLWLVEGQGTNTATVVEFKDQGGKQISSMLLGKKHMRKSNRPAPSPFGDMGDDGFPAGRYVKVGQNSRNVALISDPLSNIEPKPEHWISKDFFKAEKLKTLAVKFPEETNSWAIARESESGDWTLQNVTAAEQLDKGKASSAASALSYPSFNDALAGAKADEYGLNQPTLITATSFDGFDYTIQVGRKTNDTYAVRVGVNGQLPKERTPGKDEKPEDKAKLDKEFTDNLKKLEEKLAQEKSFENWVYLVSSWSFDSILKPRAQILVEKKDEKKDTAEGTSATAQPADDHDHDTTGDADSHEDEDKDTASDNTTTNSEN
jgi:hypothetical protein